MYAPVKVLAGGLPYHRQAKAENCLAQRKRNEITETLYNGFLHKGINAFSHVLTSINMLLMSLNIKNGVFWDDTPCGSCENRCFGGT
jgi:hypothetical protein